LQKIFTGASTIEVQVDKLVIGVAINGEAKAFPFLFITYPYQGRDTIRNTPVMVSYCAI